MQHGSAQLDDRWSGILSVGQAENDSAPTAFTSRILVSARCNADEIRLRIDLERHLPNCPGC
jgi:hypothetical protein